MYAALAAAAAAAVLKLDFSAVSKGLAEYRPSAGRLNIIRGIRGTTIIDDSYNAAPDSTKAALELLARFDAPYRLAVLGDMRELGPMTREAHLSIGALVSSLHIDELVTVGPNARLIAEAAVRGGMSRESVHSFITANEAKVFIKNKLVPGAVILLKGSQNSIRLEKIALEIMAEPQRAKELLVRQYGSWLQS